MTRILQGGPLPEALEAIAAAGLREVGLLGQHERRQAVPEDATDEQVLAIGRRVADFGLRPLLLWCGALTPERAPALRRRLEQAEMLGVRWIMGCGPGPGRPGRLESVVDEQGGRERFLTFLGEMSAQAVGRGFRLALKPHGGPMSGTGPELADTVRRVGMGALDIIYDPGNVRFYNGLDPCDDVASVAPMVAGLCIKDHRGAQGEASFPTPGDGDIRWTDFLRPLRTAGYAGPMLIECIAATDRSGATRELSVVQERLTEWWRQAGTSV